MLLGTASICNGCVHGRIEAPSLRIKATRNMIDKTEAALPLLIGDISVIHETVDVERLITLADSNESRPGDGHVQWLNKAIRSQNYIHLYLSHASPIIWLWGQPTSSGNRIVADKSVCYPSRGSATIPNNGPNVQNFHTVLIRRKIIGDFSRIY